jgi:cytidylate kinase
MLPGGIIMLNNQDVSMAIRENEVSMGASIVSGYSRVRSFLVSQQRDMAKGGGVILDGRDIGTVVLPDAELKIYQVASIECRAIRRHKENLERGIDSDLEEIKKEIAERDHADMTREISPLKKADDAIEIDTSDMSLDEVVATVMDLVSQKLG